MTNLTGKVALVTGSARGIGETVVLRYASLGKVREKAAEAVATKADVSKSREVEELFTRTIGRFGKLDIVVASAGVEIIDQPVLEATEERTLCARGVSPPIGLIPWDAYPLAAARDQALGFERVEQRHEEARVNTPYGLAELSLAHGAVVVQKPEYLVLAGFEAVGVEGLAQAAV